MAARDEQGGGRGHTNGELGPPLAASGCRGVPRAAEPLAIRGAVAPRRYVVNEVCPKGVGEEGGASLDSLRERRPWLGGRLYAQAAVWLDVHGGQVDHSGTRRRICSRCPTARPARRHVGLAS